MLINP